MLRLTYRRHATLSAAAQGFLQLARALAQNAPPPANPAM
jgi:ABC-type hemin transport system ATPase subunit